MSRRPSDRQGTGPGGPAGFDPFATLGIEPRFDLDPAAVRSAFRARASGCHPDRAGAASERSALARSSAELAEAQRILLDPILRGEALIACLGGRVIAGPPGGEFLVEMMEIRESIDAAASDRVRLESIFRDIENRMAELRDRIATTLAELAGRSGAERSAGLRVAADSLGSLRYLERLRRATETALRDSVEGV